jgi:hypothetical protein
MERVKGIEPSFMWWCKVVEICHRILPFFLASALWMFQFVVCRYSVTLEL